jgi:DNA-binding GntR family transcriptional regulator
MPSSLLSPVAKQPLRLDLARRMIGAIFRGELKGGERLVETELARRFGVSRTPVREAISQLAMVGMVELRSGRGAIIRRFGPEELREIYHVRAVLEAEAAQLACQRLGREVVEAAIAKAKVLLGQTNRDSAWSRSTMLADRQFHDLIAGHCGKARLQEEISRYQKLVQAVREAIGNRSSAQERALKEHLVILERLLARDSEAAGKAMKSHIQEAAKAAVHDLLPGPASNPREASAEAEGLEAGSEADSLVGLAQTDAH